MLIRFYAVWLLPVTLLKLHKATTARYRLERQHNACDIGKKQCRPIDAKLNSKVCWAMELLTLSSLYVIMMASL